MTKTAQYTTKLNKKPFTKNGINAKGCILAPYRIPENTITL